MRYRLCLRGVLNAIIQNRAYVGPYGGRAGSFQNLSRPQPWARNSYLGPESTGDPENEGETLINPEHNPVKVLPLGDYET